MVDAPKVSRNRLCDAVLFDMDDTLIDRSSAYEFAYRCFYDDNPALNLTTSWENAKAFFWSLSPWRTCEPTEAFRAIAKRWPNVKGSPESHHAYYYERIVSSIKPFEGVMELVGELNRRSSRWGVVTNGGEYQRKKLVKTGLDRVVPSVVISGEFGQNKPDKRIFTEALRLLEVDASQPQNVLFIGDNPYTDVAGGASAGMRTGWMAWGREYPADVPRPDYVLQSVSEMTDLVLNSLQNIV